MKTFTPCIIVPGIGQSKVDLLDKNNKRVKAAWPLELDTDDFISKLKKPLLKSVIFRRDMGFSEKIGEAVKDALYPVATDKDGVPENNLKIVEYNKSLAECTPEEKRYILKMVPMQKLCKIIGEENLYFFSFNSFGEPYKTADRLNDFIQQVKKEKKCDKVNLIPVSLGGVVSIAYLDKYAHQQDIKRVMYFVAALQGTYFISDTMEMNIKKENAASLIEFLTNKKTSDSITKITGLLPKKVKDKVLDSCFDSLSKTLLKNCAMMWGAVPPEKYLQLREKYIDEKNQKVLAEKTDKFFAAQKAFPEKISDYKSMGIEFFAVAGYGLQLIPVLASDKINSDTIIPVKSASLGAESADLGQTLNREKTEYISPDNTVDASKSVIKDTVWFFKNQPHDDIAYNDTALDIAAHVLAYDDFNSVHSDEKFPRFANRSDNRK